MAKDLFGGMVTLPVLVSELEIAAQESKDIAHIKSVTSGGPIVGILGELAVYRWLRYLGVQRQNTFQHDLVFGKWSFDIKSRRRSCLPRLDYCANVFAYPDQDCSAYIFTSVRYVIDQPRDITLCGWMGKDQFKKTARLTKKGEVSPDNGWVCLADCYSLTYAELKPLQSLEHGLWLA